MKTADELFKELGYEKEEDNYGMIEFKKTEKEKYYGKKNYDCFYAKYTIVFSPAKDGIYSFYKYSNYNNAFTMQELKAINQFCKEKGWLDEK